MDYMELQLQYSEFGLNYTILSDDYDQLIEDYDALSESYASLIENLLERKGGEQYARQLITPDDPSVVPKRQEVLGGDHDGELTGDDMDGINSWIRRSIVYNSDTDPPMGEGAVWDEC